MPRWHWPGESPASGSFSVTPLFTVLGLGRRQHRRRAPILGVKQMSSLHLQDLDNFCQRFWMGGPCVFKIKDQANRPFQSSPKLQAAPSRAAEPPISGGSWFHVRLRTGPMPRWSSRRVLCFAWSAPSPWKKVAKWKATSFEGPQIFTRAKQEAKYLLAFCSC